MRSFKILAIVAMFAIFAMTSFAASNCQNQNINKSFFTSVFEAPASDIVPSVPTVTRFAAFSQLIFERDSTAAVPAGYERVSVYSASDVKGKRLWLKTYGNLDGYSLEQANKITILTPIGTVPCDCIQTPELPYRYMPKPRGCEDLC